MAATRLRARTFPCGENGFDPPGRPRRTRSRTPRTTRTSRRTSSRSRCSGRPGPRHLQPARARRSEPLQGGTRASWCRGQCRPDPAQRGRSQPSLSAAPPKRRTRSASLLHPCRATGRRAKGPARRFRPLRRSRRPLPRFPDRRRSPSRSSRPQPSVPSSRAPSESDAAFH